MSSYHNFDRVIKKKDGVFLLHLPYETAFKSSLTPPLLEQQGRASWARRAAAPCLLRAATKREIAVGEEEERSKNLNYRGGEEQHGNRKGITTVPEQKGFPTGSPRRATYACFNSWNILLVSQITNKITWGGGKTDRWKSNLLALVPTSHTPPVAEPLAQLPWLEHCKSPPNFLHLLSPLQDQRPCYGYNTSAWTLTWILHQLCYFEAQFSFSFMTWCKPRCFGFQKKRSSVVCSTSSYLPNISEPF